MRAGQGAFEEAERIIDQVLQANPDLAEAWHLQGEMQAVGFGNHLGAQRAYRKALEKDRAYLPAHLALISDRIRSGDLEGAAAQAATLQQALPRHPQTQLVLAQLAYGRADFRAAHEGVLEVLRVSPDEPDALLLAGLLEADGGSPVVAQAHLQRLLQARPAHPLARRTLARSFVAQGKHAAALDILQPLLAPERPDADAHAAAGEAYMALKKPAEAEQHFAKAVQIDPNNIRTRTSLALTHLARDDAGRAFSELQRLAASSPDTHADFAIIQAHLQRQEHDKALQAANTLLRKDSGNAQLLDLTGRIHLARKDAKAAREAFNVAAKIDPGSLNPVMQLARLDVQDGDPEAASQRLVAALKRHPKNPDLYLTLADVRSRSLAQPDEILKTLVEAVRVAPTHAPARVQLIEFCLRQMRTGEAVAYAQEALAALPNDISVMRAAGKAQVAGKEFEQAITTFRRLTDLALDDAAAHVRLAEVYQSAGRTHNAEIALRKAIDIDPGLDAAHEQLVAMLFEQGRQEQALELARTLQQRLRAQPVGYIIEAATALRQQQPEQAAAAITRGMAAQDNASALARKYYALLQRMGRPQDAQQWAAAWLAQNPEDVVFEHFAAAQAIGQGRWEEAEQRLQRVLARRPALPSALNNLAWVLSQRQKPGAVSLAQRAVEARPEDPDFLDTLAAALAAERQPAKALEVQRRAVELNPDDPGMRVRLARIALSAGDASLARGELQRLRVLGADFAFRAEVDQLLKSI
jgi:putative PEP-CTERM system TPR-repeat lipoprotein